MVEIADLLGNAKLAIGDGFRAKNDQLGLDGLPFIRAGNLNSGISLKGAERIQSAVVASDEKLSQPRDVAFTSKGTVGRFAFVRDDLPQFVYSPQICFWRSLDHQVIDPRFLYYWMQGRECQAQFDAVKGSMDMADYISLRDQRTMKITLPPTEVQRSIGEILGSLDDKIETNRRLAGTLEEIAATLFRAQFVEFAGHDDLVESEIGPIPRGWEVAPIGEVIEICGGTTPSTKNPDFWEGGTTAWATPKDLSGLNSPVLRWTGRQITEAGLARIGSGLLPRGTVLLSSRAPVGYTAIADTPLAVNQGFIAIPPSPKIPKEYLLFWLRNNLELIRANAGGTTFAEISKKAFRPLPMLVPNRGELSGFERVAGPIISRIAAADRESETLAEIRDTLLPRLISGEIRVPEAEEIVEEAV